MSLKNYFRKRVYKERAQPSSRKKFGLLEKHKDYVERAKAYHKKQDTLRILRQKAANRNPDEFSFKMIGTTKNTKRNRDEVNDYTREELVQMKIKDIGYVVQRIQQEKKKIEKKMEKLTALRDRITELKTRKSRLKQLEKIHKDMTRSSKWI